MSNNALVNMAWQLGGNRELLHAACAGTDILLVVEGLSDGGKKVERIGPLLPDGWHTSQNTSSPAMAGSAVCWRDEVIDYRGHDLIQLSPKGRNVRPRYLNVAYLTDRRNGDSRRWGAAHAPLKATGVKDDFYVRQDRYIDNHPNCVIGMDSNLPPSAVQKRLGRQTIGVEVMTVNLPKGLPILGQSSDEHPNSDHPIFRFTTGKLHTPRRRTSKRWWDNI